MKTVLCIHLILLSISTFASQIDGEYDLATVHCSSGKTLKMGGPFIDIKMHLSINGNAIDQRADAISKDYAPFKVRCTIINSGEYEIIGANQYRGELIQKSCVCSSKKFTELICPKGMGTIPYGITDFDIEDNTLKIMNHEEIGRYKTCSGEALPPIFTYKKS
jgi:hypothetical protein